MRPSQPALEKSSLKEVLQQTLDFLKHEIRDRDVLVEVEEADDVPPALLDRNQIKQAFSQLLLFPFFRSSNPSRQPLFSNPYRRLTLKEIARE